MFGKYYVEAYFAHVFVTRVKILHVFITLCAK